MPITQLQSRALRAIAANRSPESYLAGATVLHRADETPRYSLDVDLFHDLAESVAACAETDAATLGEAGYELTWLLRTPAFYRAVLTWQTEQLRIEWAQDSSFRFFPVEQDDACGWRLHHADAAVNKVLALAGRHEVRDFVDAMHLHETFLPLGALAWAACGKDPGFTPRFLLDQVARHAAHTQADVDRLSLRVPIDLPSMKKQWLAALDASVQLVDSLPTADLGCLYLDSTGKPVPPDPGAVDFKSLIRHHGQVRGAWPTIT